MRLEWLPMAISDFNKIGYIAVDNPLAALEQSDEIDSQVTGLLANCNMGRPGRTNRTQELVIVRHPTLSPIGLLRRTS